MRIVTVSLLALFLLYPCCTHADDHEQSASFDGFWFFRYQAGWFLERPSDGELVSVPNNATILDCYGNEAVIEAYFDGLPAVVKCTYNATDQDGGCHVVLVKLACQ